MARISRNAIPDLKSQIDAATSEPHGIPGLVFSAVNKNGDVIFEHASGKVGQGKDQDMTVDSVFWIASCTKMITGIACMQLVEQGKLKLDDIAGLEKLAPELKAVQVYENGKLVPKKRGITLRMLLSHTALKHSLPMPGFLIHKTAGFGYAFFNQRLIDWAGPRGLNELSGSYHDYLCQPLVNQPGEVWEYGINIDWAGQLVERASGLKLNDYFQQHIFKPLGIQNINMFPADSMKERLVYMNARDSGGKLSLNLDGHLNRRPLYATDSKEIETTFHQGGAGCFAVPREFCQIISVLLNNGLHRPTGQRILREETVKEMFTNQIPEMPNFARQGITPSKPHLANPMPEMYPEDHSVPQGWGLTFFLHLHDSAVHSEGTGWWAGLPNLFWWADRKRGLGGIIASQIIPFGDKKVLGLWAQLESAILQNLE